MNLEAESLIGRIVDGEATPRDCEAFEQLAASESEWWRTLAHRQLDTVMLSHQVARRTEPAQLVDVAARRRLPGAGLLLSLSGWAAVLIVATWWAVAAGGGPSPESDGRIERVAGGGAAARRLSPDEHYREYLAADWVLGELDPILLETEPLEDGRTRLRIIRRIEEYVDIRTPMQSVVDDMGKLTADPAELRREASPGE